VDSQVPRRRNSRAQFKRIRNRRNRRIREEVLNVVNSLLDQVTESLETFSPSTPSPSPVHISSPISEERFPSPSRYDPVSSPSSSPEPPLSPTCYSPPPVSPVYPDVFPLSPSPSSTSSVEFLGEIPAPASPLQPHDEEFPFIPIITHFPQVDSPPPPGAYTIGPDPVDLDHLRRVVSTANPDHGIFVYLPGIPLPYLIPVTLFYDFFPPSSITLHEL